MTPRTPFRQPAPKEPLLSEELRQANVALRMQNIRAQAAEETSRAATQYGYSGKVPMAAAIVGGVIAFAVIFGALNFVGLALARSISVAALMAILLSGFLLIRR